MSSTICIWCQQWCALHTMHGVTHMRTYHTTHCVDRTLGSVSNRSDTHGVDYHWQWQTAELETSSAFVFFIGITNRLFN